MKIPHRKKDLFLPMMLGVSTLLCLICFMSHSSGSSTILSKGLSIVTTPLRAGTKIVYDVVSSLGVYFSDIDKMRDENDRLYRENKRLTEENRELSELSKENDSLYKFLELKKERTDFKFTSANIISKSSSGYSSYFTIDKGSFHGLCENMPIISDDGALLGITYSVEPSSARCKSILSYDMNVGIYNEACGETGILSGSFETFKDGKCTISNLSDTHGMKKDDKILTSGLGNIYPRGLVIGTIDSFIPQSTSHTFSAVVTPNALLSDSVMVITAFERIYE